MDNNPKVVSGDTNKNGSYTIGSNDNIAIDPNNVYYWQVVVYDCCQPGFEGLDSGEYLFDDATTGNDAAISGRTAYYESLLSGH